MTENKIQQIPLEKQAPLIDVIFWNLIESKYYADIPETTGMMENLKKDKESIREYFKKKGGTGEELKQLDLDIEDLTVGASLYGEEKGFILGFIYGTKMISDISDVYALLQKSEVANK